MPDLSRLWWNLGYLTVGIVVAVIVIYLIARRFRREEEPTSDGVFTLQDLREMKAAGQISHKEYERLRAAVLGSAGIAASPAAREEPTQADVDSASSGEIDGLYDDDEPEDRRS